MAHCTTSWSKPTDDNDENDNKWKDTLFFWQGSLTTTKTRIEPPQGEVHDAVIVNDSTAAAAAAVAAATATTSTTRRRTISVRDAVWQGSRISIPHCPDARRAATPIRFPTKEECKEDENDENPLPQFSISGKAFNVVPNNNTTNEAAAAKKKGAAADKTTSSSDVDEFDTEAATIVMFTKTLTANNSGEEDGFELDGEEEEEKQQQQSTTTTSSRYHQDNEHLLVFPEGIYKDKQVVVGRGWNDKFGPFIEVGWSREEFDDSQDHMTFMAENQAQEKAGTAWWKFKPEGEEGEETEETTTTDQPPPIDYTQPFIMKILLARRYLQHQDERSRWSLDMLSSQIKMDLPFSPLGEGPWSRILEFVHGTFSSSSSSSSSSTSQEPGLSRFSFLPWAYIHPVWRTIVFHSELWGLQNNEDVIQDDDDDNDGIMSMLPYSSGLPIHLTGPLLPDDNEELTNGGRVLDFRFIDRDEKHFIPNTFWDGQCWGCGKIVANPKKLIKFHLTSTLEVGPETFQYLMGQYCCTDCIGPTVPEIVRSSTRWKHLVSASLAPPAQESEQQEQAQNAAAPRHADAASDHDDDHDDLKDSWFYECYNQEHDSIQMTSSDHAQFWNCLNDSQVQAMKDAGWESHDDDNSCWLIIATAPIPTQATTETVLEVVDPAYADMPALMPAYDPLPTNGIWLVMPKLSSSPSISRHGNDDDDQQQVVLQYAFVQNSCIKSVQRGVFPNGSKLLSAARGVIWVYAPPSSTSTDALSNTLSTNNTTHPPRSSWALYAARGDIDVTVKLYPFDVTTDDDNVAGSNAMEDQLASLTLSESGTESTTASHLVLQTSNDKIVIDKQEDHGDKGQGALFKEDLAITGPTCLVTDGVGAVYALVPIDSNNTSSTCDCVLIRIDCKYPQGKQILQSLIPSNSHLYRSCAGGVWIRIVAVPNNKNSDDHTMIINNIPERLSSGIWYITPFASTCVMSQVSPDVKISIDGSCNGLLLLSPANDEAKTELESTSPTSSASLLVHIGPSGELHRIIVPVNFDDVQSILDEGNDRGVMIHCCCHESNRWKLYRVWWQMPSSSLAEIDDDVGVVMPEEFIDCPRSTKLVTKGHDAMWMWKKAGKSGHRSLSFVNQNGRLVEKGGDCFPRGTTVE